MERKLGAAIRAERSKGEIAVLRLSEVADFEWTHVSVFLPYTPVIEVERVLEIEWTEAESTGIYERDDITLLVFTNGPEVTKYLEFSLSMGEFRQNVERSSRIETVFEIMFKDGRHPHLSIIDPR